MADDCSNFTFDNIVIMDIKTKVGERIEELKQKAKLSNTFLAWDSELDPSYIISVIKGKRNISMKCIEKICIALGISVADFFNDSKFE